MKNVLFQLIKNRKIKVELNLNEDRNRNRGPQRDFESQEDRTVGDWRSARAELPPPPPGRGNVLLLNAPTFLLNALICAEANKLLCNWSFLNNFDNKHSNT